MKLREAPCKSQLKDVAVFKGEKGTQENHKDLLTVYQTSFLLQGGHLKTCD